MRYLLFCMIVIVSCAPRNATHTTKRIRVFKPRLPLMLGFRETGDSMKQIFRQQIALKGVDTINWREGLRLMSEEMLNKIQAAKQNKTSNGHTMMNFDPKSIAINVKVIGNETGVVRIGWCAAPIPSRVPLDTTLKYYIVPDSLRSQTAKAFSACIDAMFTDPVFRR